jgi:hypothetical protein
MAMKKTPPTLTKPWRSVTDIRDSLTRAREFGEQHRKQIADLNGRVDSRRKELESTLSDLPPSHRTQVVNRALGGLRADLKRGSVEARGKRLRDLDALRRSVEDARAHYASPMQMLARDSLGSERRTRLMQQIEHSGDAELSSLAALAVSTNDRELGAVLASRVQRIPHGSRPFSPLELADLLVGDEYRAIQSATLEVVEIAHRAMNADQEFETGRPNSLAAVNTALRARDRAELGVNENALETLANSEKE